MADAPKIEGSKLVVLRMAGVALIIASINYAYIGYTTGIIQVGTRRHSLLMTGENLWLGYLYWLSNLTVSIFLLFANKGQTKLFNTLAKIFGGAWFAVMAACILTDISTR